MRAVTFDQAILEFDDSEEHTSRGILIFELRSEKGGRRENEKYRGEKFLCFRQRGILLTEKRIK